MKKNWNDFNHKIQYCVDDIHSRVHNADITVQYSDDHKLWYMWEIMHALMNKFLATIVTSDIDNKIEAKKQFLEWVMQSCEGALEHRLQEGIDDRSSST